MNPIRAKQKSGQMQKSGHLNDDQFTDVLIGEQLSSDATAHLSQCEACREELARFGSSVGDFNTASLAWSVSHAAGSSIEANRVRRFESRSPIMMAASWALAACLTVMAGVAVVQHREASSREANVASMVPPHEDSEAEIAQDNKLLADVEREIHGYDRSPVQEYGLQSMANGHTKSHGESKTQ